jgi:ribosomal-protein-serine acetyltransferase
MYGLRVDDDIRLALPLDHHAEAVFALIEADRRRFETWIPPIARVRTLADQRAVFRDRRAALADGAVYSYVTEVNGEVGGTLALAVAPDDRRGEIGYLLASRFEGRGIVTRSVAALIDTAIGQLGIYRFEIHCAPGNPRSSAIPQRLGFRHEGTLRGYLMVDNQPQDQEVYGLLAPDWTGRADHQ